MAWTRRILTRHDTELIDPMNIDAPWHATFGTWHAQNLGPNSWTYFAPMFPLVEDMSKKTGTTFLKIFCTHVPTSWRHVRNICPSSDKSIWYFSVCYWVGSQCSTSSAHNNRGARGWERHTGGARPCCVLRRLSLGWLLNGKQKNSIYSFQRIGIHFGRVFN